MRAGYGVCGIDRDATFGGLPDDLHNLLPQPRHDAERWRVHQKLDFERLLSRLCLLKEYAAAFDAENSHAGLGRGLPDVFFEFGKFPSRQLRTIAPPPCLLRHASVVHILQLVQEELEFLTLLSAALSIAARPWRQTYSARFLALVPGLK